jgi:HAD superfamily hydrolase (TIGR01509 family)
LLPDSSVLARCRVDKVTGLVALIDTACPVCYNAGMMHAVLFDFSGTLVDCGPTWWALEVTTTVHAPLTILNKRGVISVSDAALQRADDLYAEMKRVARETCIEVSAQDALHRALAGLGLSVPDHVINQTVDEIFGACLPDAVARDGALETLQALQQQGLVAAVISNARYGPYVPQALDRLGMKPFLRSVTTSADARLRKPHPDIFRNVLAALDVAPHDAAFVGDYYPHDMAGARAAGMHAVWLVEPGQPRDNLPVDLVIARLPELLPALLQLRSV